MTGSAAIVGAGITGRVLATTLIQRGWSTTLFESRSEMDQSGCSATAAGLLAPLAELDTADERVAKWGLESVELWPSLLRGVETEIFFERQGSLVVALPSENEELIRLENRVKSYSVSAPMERVSRERLLQLEPELDSRFSQGIFFPLEGQMDNRQCLAALAKKIVASGGHIEYQSRVCCLEPHSIVVNETKQTFDWVIDCRGLDAKADLNLRGVRGELFLVETSDVHFTRPVRLMHRRHPLYVVPRPDAKFLLGATCLETETLTPVTLRSSLEILSMAYSLHSGFSEARVLESRVQLRPAFPDNFPKVSVCPGRIRVNGMYRHGYLLSPAISREVAEIMEGGHKSSLAVEESDETRR